MKARSAKVRQAPNFRSGRRVEKNLGHPAPKHEQTMSIVPFDGFRPEASIDL